ncbi:putative gpi transamidase component pig [Phaeomoniella chlamydospora]|uniref:Putative gpi transamidase component pig n=1 Tax=Phaeomoniella chlamydospora TaxID=158046 RepID=A0A0G2E5L9_PHACM|nr:putative gpi transamidase component pig [Phaeomoniella chlamydospora]
MDAHKGGAIILGGYSLSWSAHVVEDNFDISSTATLPGNARLGPRQYDLNEFSPHHLRLRLISAKDVDSGSGNRGCGLEETDAQAEPALTVKLDPREGHQPDLRLDNFSLDGNLLYTPSQLPSQSSSMSQLSAYLANKLHTLFIEEQASIAYKFASQSAGQATRSNGNPSAFTRSLPKGLYEKISSRDTRSFPYSNTFHLTFSLFSAGATPSSWDIADALETHIQPWVEALSSISEFTINSQIQLYSQFSPSVRLIEDGATNSTRVAQADLSAFINAAEWPLSPSIGSAGPTINFVLYIPSIAQSPLTIADTNGATEWLIPQWGGVAIYNPMVTHDGARTVPHHVDTKAVAAAFTTFRAQLLALLGLPGDHEVPLPLRIQSLRRLQTTALFLSASSTLGSLARLTQSLPSIPIPLSVSRSVESTINHLAKTCSALALGHFDDALRQAREAEKEAEKAFFEKSMVGQVYFPDEHKVAVYLPLLGPISFPLILGLVKEIKRFISLRRAKS